MSESEREFVRIGGLTLTAAHYLFGLALPIACCLALPAAGIMALLFG